MVSERAWQGGHYAMECLTTVVICLATWAATSHGFGQRSLDARGVIRGVVINERNEPVSEAIIELQPQAKVVHGILPSTQSDRDGRFVVDHLMWGPYRIFVSKEKDGYPNTTWGIYTIGSTPVAKISPDCPETEIAVNVGPKAAIIIVHASNSLTGETVDSALVGVSIWRWPDHRRDWLSGTLRENDSFFIPANTAVGVEIDAQGYSPLRYPDKVQLGSGAKMTIAVKLLPFQK